MAFRQANDSQNASLEDTVFLDGKAGISGERWIKPAGWEKKGRYAFLINIYEPDRDISKAIGGTL